MIKKMTNNSNNYHTHILIHVFSEISHENEKENLLPFSERVISLDCNRYQFLHGRPVTRIEFAPYQPDVFVSCHGYSSSAEERSSNHDSNEEEYCYLCLWNVNYPSIVQKGKISNFFDLFI